MLRRLNGFFFIGWILLKLSFLLYGLIVIFNTIVYANVDDLRFFPNFALPRTNIHPYSFIRVSFFATSASSAFIDTEEIKPIPVIFGDFDLNDIATALERTGRPNPLRTDLRISLPFKVSANFDTQGCVFKGEFHIIGDPYEKKGALSIGTSLMAGRSNAAYRFKFNTVESRITALSPSDIALIERTRKQVFSLLGLNGDHASNIGFGDMIAYIRHFHSWDFTWKLRHLQLGLTAAVLIPTGTVTTPFKPHAIPLGGNGHWGIQFGFDGIFQIKEFIKTGIDLKISQRLKKTRTIRIPVNNEPYIFGALVTRTQIIPGATLHCSPYLVMENLRPDLNLGLQYTLIHHIRDTWHDIRTNPTVPSTLQTAIKFSSWASEYITMFGIYEKNCEDTENTLLHSLSASVDIPLSFFNAHHVPKTYRGTVNFSLYF